MAFFSFIMCHAYAEEKYAWQWIKEEKFISSYKKLNVGHSLPSWAMDFKGPSDLSYKVKIGDSEYTVVHACKPHDCAHMNITVLYSASGKSFALFNGSSTHFMGSPEVEAQEELLDLHQSKYKSSNVKVRLTKGN